MPETERRIKGKPKTGGTSTADTLPRFCECGGRVVYVDDFGRTFSYCEACTPVVVVRGAK